MVSEKAKRRIKRIAIHTLAKGTRNIQAWILLPIIFNYSSGIVFQLLISGVIIGLLIKPLYICEFLLMVIFFSFNSSLVVDYFRLLHTSMLWLYLIFIVSLSIVMSITIVLEKIILVFPIKTIYKVYKDEIPVRKETSKSTESIHNSEMGESVYYLARRHSTEERSRNNSLTSEQSRIHREIRQAISTSSINSSIKAHHNSNTSPKQTPHSDTELHSNSNSHINHSPTHNSQLHTDQHTNPRLHSHKRSISQGGNSIKSEKSASQSEGSRSIKSEKSSKSGKSTKTHTSHGSHQTIILYEDNEEDINGPKVKIVLKKAYENKNLHIKKSIASTDINTYKDEKDWLFIVFSGLRGPMYICIFLVKLVVASALLANTFFLYTERTLLIGVLGFSALLFAMIADTTFQKLYMPKKNYTHSFTVIAVLFTYYIAWESPYRIEDLNICSASNIGDSWFMNKLCKIMAYIPNTEDIAKTSLYG